MKFRVECRTAGWARDEIVEADYFRIEQRCLVFRNNRHGPDAYPTIVKAFAFGAWETVEPVAAD